MDSSKQVSQVAIFEGGSNPRIEDFQGETG